MKVTRHSAHTTIPLRDESGMASILITLVLMIVITLIILGFAQISRRDQREALDNQLSTQAFYAAETGVNLVQHLMQTTTNTTSLDKTSCSPSGMYLNKQLQTSNVATTCLLVDSSPSSLAYSDVGINSTVVPLIPAAGGYGTGSLTLTWQPQAQTGNDLSKCPTFGTFPPSSSWAPGCPYGVLRFDMVDVTAADAPLLAPASLENQSITVFAPPIANHAAIVKVQGGMKGVPQNIHCTNTQCTLQVTGVNFDDTYYLRVSSLYKDVVLSSISGTAPNAPNNQVRFTGAQIVVDSTGRAADVLRRVQVRLSPSTVLAPAFAISGGKSVCKLYTSTGPGVFNNAGCP